LGGRAGPGDRPRYQAPEVSATAWDDPQTLGAFLDAVRWITAWTGPASHVTSGHLTAVAIIELIAARTQIVLVSFATRTEPAIAEALTAAAARGMEIILLAERWKPISNAASCCAAALTLARSAPTSLTSTPPAASAACSSVIGH